MGTISTAINYSFQITDLTTYPPIASSGFDAVQTGTLSNGETKTFTFQAPAGLPVFFNNLGFTEPMGADLTAPGGATIFDYAASTSGNAGPYILTSSGAYTLTLNNTSGSSGTYDFDLLSLPSAATSLARATQTVSGMLTNGLSTTVYSFSGAAGERLFLDNQLTVNGPGELALYKPDGSLAFGIGSSQDGGPLSLTENGTYYLLVEGTTSAALAYQFRLTDTAYSPLTFGSTTSGTVTTATQSDVYSFTGTANERSYFRTA